MNVELVMCRLAQRRDRCASNIRALLYDAAHVLLSRAKRDSELRSWGLALKRRIGAKKAKVAVARKLAWSCTPCGPMSPPSKLLRAARLR